MNISKHQVEAYFFGSPGFIADKILLIKRDTRLAEYKKHLINVQGFGNVWHGITGLFRGQTITIIVTEIGPSMVGDAIYALNRRDSVCLYSGTCGGLHEGLEIGDYFVADRAICGDGYTLHFGYAPMTEISGDFRLTARLKSLIASRVERVSNGVAFTTSSVVRETDADFWQGVNKKCQIIEMAAAACYAAAVATGIRAATYFWVSDLPTRGKSFFETLTLTDIQTKQHRYDQTAALDLELLYSL